MKLNFLSWFLLPLTAFAQLPNADFDTIYVQLDRQSNAIGYIGHKEGQQNEFAEAFKRLSWNFSDDDLRYIGNNGNAIMRASAGKELVDRKSAELPELFRTLIGSAENVESHSGTFSNQIGLAAVLFNEVAYQKEKLDRKAYYEKTMSEAQVRGMKELFGSDFDSKWTGIEADSVLQSFAAIALAYDAVSPQTLGQILKTTGYTNKDRSRVLYFAQKSPTPEILATLASFKNPADLPMLRKNLPASYLAVSIYPHPALLADLKLRLIADFPEPDFQRAVAAYKNTQSKAILQSVFDKILATYPEGTIRAEKVHALHGIVEKANARLYDDLLIKWEKAM